MHKLNAKKLLLQLQTDDSQLPIKTIEQIADHGKEAHNAYSQLLSLLQSSSPKEGPLWLISFG